MKLSFSDAPPSLPWQRSARPLEESIINFSTSEGAVQRISLNECFRGTQIFGTTGSGKTSGSGRTIAAGFLRANFGGLVLAVKNDEANTWRQYAKECGREKDLVVVSPESGHSFNFVNALASNGRHSVIDICQLILDVYDLYSRESSKGGQDSFWQDQLQSCLTHAISLARYSDEGISIKSIPTILYSAENYAETFVHNLEMKRVHEFQKFCEKLAHDPNFDHSAEFAVDFFLKSFKNVPEKTRSIIVRMFESIFEPMSQFPLNQVFGSDSSIGPEDILKGKIVVIDVPIHDYRKAGLLCQLIWKISFLNSVTKRHDTDIPVFLWADESQYFVEERDINFLTTARSKKCAVVYLTQNVSNYLSVLGSESKVASILGSLNTKIYHQNNDPKTNELAVNLIGKILKTRTSHSSRANFLDSFLDSARTKTVSKSYEDEISSRTISELKNGGRANSFIVEGIVHMPGRNTGNGRSWFKAEFQQQLSK